MAIGRIRRRAELSEDPVQRKELNLQAGNLFLDKFNNQAEAIKSFESVLEDDDLNVEAITKLKDLYQRRRDWEKMLFVQQKELALIEDPVERKAQLLEVARTAGAKIKKPSVAIELWSQVIELDLSRPGAGAELFVRMQELRLPLVDFLVNNAGFGTSGFVAGATHVTKSLEATTLGFSYVES